MNTSANILVVGGGIGGLTAGVALKRLGFTVTVFEAAREFTDAGYGLLLGANAVKTLGGLGLAGRLREAGAKANVGNLYASSGRVLTSISEEELRRRVGEDSYAVHRADLQRILLDSLGRERVVTGARCVSFDQDSEGVRAYFEDGSEAAGDVLIGADGFDSAIRGQLFGAARARYAGYTAWRGLAHLDKVGDFPTTEEVFETWGRGARFGYARLDAPGSARNRVYWFATRNAPEGGDDGGEARANLLKVLRGWHEPIEELVRATREEDIRRDDIFDVRPLQTWSRRRVTLVGDAAHPMTPNLGQGACQAMEDAFALGISLRGARDIQHALFDYEFRRVDRVKEIASISRNLGRVGQLENPVMCALRNRAVGVIPTSLKMRQFERILGSA